MEKKIKGREERELIAACASAIILVICITAIVSVFLLRREQALDKIEEGFDEFITLINEEGGVKK